MTPFDWSSTTDTDTFVAFPVWEDRVAWIRASSIRAFVERPPRSDPALNPSRPGCRVLLDTTEVWVTMTANEAMQHLAEVLVGEAPDPAVFE